MSQEEAVVSPDIVPREGEDDSNPASPSKDTTSVDITDAANAELSTTNEQPKASAAAEAVAEPPAAVLLHVANLTRNVTPAHIKEIFGTFGEVKNIEMLPPVRGIIAAHVSFAAPDDAANAQAHMDGGQLDGNKLAVTFVLLNKDSTARRGRRSRSPDANRRGKGGDTNVRDNKRQNAGGNSNNNNHNNASRDTGARNTDRGRPEVSRPGGGAASGRGGGGGGGHYGWQSSSSAGAGARGRRSPSPRGGYRRDRDVGSKYRREGGRFASRSRSRSRSRSWNRRRRSRSPPSRYGRGGRRSRSRSRSRGRRRSRSFSRDRRAARRSRSRSASSASSASSVRYRRRRGSSSSRSRSRSRSSSASYSSKSRSRSRSASSRSRSRSYSSRSSRSRSRSSSRSASPKK